MGFLGTGPGGFAAGSVNAGRLARAGIAVVAFALFTHLIYKATLLVLRAAMRPFFETAEDWPVKLDVALSVAALLLGLRIAFAISRRLWPAPTVEDFVRAREAAEARQRAAELAPAAQTPRRPEELVLHRARRGSPPPPEPPAAGDDS